MSRSGVILALLLTLAPCAPATAWDDSPAPDAPSPAQSLDLPIAPLDCQARATRIEALQASDDPFMTRLGEFLQRPEHRYCRIETVRVTAERDFSFNFMTDFSVLGELARVLAIGLLVGLVLWLAVRLRHWSPRAVAAGRDTPATAPASESTAIPATPKALPDDVPAGAEAAWRAGWPRQALSLLFRGAVVRLFPEPAHLTARTEQELLELAVHSKLDAADGALLRTLTGAWQQTAWGRQPPTDDAFRALLATWRERLNGHGWR